MGEIVAPDGSKATPPTPREIRDEFLAACIKRARREGDVTKSQMLNAIVVSLMTVDRLGEVQHGTLDLMRQLAASVQQALTGLGATPATPGMAGLVALIEGRPPDGAVEAVEADHA